MTDTIFIHGIVIHARHGVLEHEAEVGQRFVIDLELSTDLSRTVAHRQAEGHDFLFGRGCDGDQGLRRPQLLSAGARGRRGRRCSDGGVPDGQPR